ncbi:MAG: hypothetical protein U0M78_04580 [Sellimonas sp.]|nr:hypothetical protein [Sellimonas sp.]MEE0780898.1 hypothetical protein [Sellimonas sp.]
MNQEAYLYTAGDLKSELKEINGMQDLELAEAVEGFTNPAEYPFLTIFCC